MAWAHPSSVALALTEANLPRSCQWAPTESASSPLPRGWHRLEVFLRTLRMGVFLVLGHGFDDLKHHSLSSADEVSEANPVDLDPLLEVLGLPNVLVGSLARPL
eukprot:6975128-Alexandrium_andersonii.AAC.1